LDPLEGADLLASQGEYRAARLRLWSQPMSAAVRDRLQGYMLRLAQVSVTRSDLVCHVLVCCRALLFEPVFIASRLV